MSDKRDDFWKELMGEDFVLPDERPEKPRTDDAPKPADVAPPPADVQRPAKPAPDAAQEPPLRDMGFKIEYVNKDGQNLNKAAPQPAQPQSGQRSDESTARPKNESAPVRGPENGRPAGARGSDMRRGDAGGGESRKSDPTDDFEVNFDFDEEYADVEEKAVRRGRTKRTGCLSGILMFLLILGVSTLLACVGWIAATDVLGLGDDDVEVEVTLPSSIFTQEEREKENEDGEKEKVTVSVADIDAVADELYDKGVIKYKWLFKLFAKISTADEKIKPGTYLLNQSYDYRAIVKGMTGTGGKRQEVEVTIPEGYTITQIVDILVENKVCEREELLEAMENYDFDYDFLDSSTLGQPKRLEGYLFPDTYKFYVGDTPERVIDKFLNNFESKWSDEFDDIAENLGYTPREILIIASMIEEEAGADSERSTIASVIYNRLKNPGAHGTNGLLQIDATIYYIIADTGEAFSTDIDNPYNTYKYEGLPPGPITNPGIASIRAALEPKSTNYYYYALGKDGIHEFFTGYDEFTAFVNSDRYGG